MRKVKKWIWQHKKYPEFNYHLDNIASILSKVSRNTGKLEYAVHIFDQNNIHDIIINATTNEIVQSSKIEGEILNRDSVRSSIRKKFENEFDLSEDYSTSHTDGLVDILIDSSFNHTPLTKERIHGWHNALFPIGYSGGYKIEVAKYRSEEMLVVSNKGYQEIVHYVAPPYKQLDNEVKKLLNYINNSTEDPYIKSAIAHLWFVAIHPYDDGNGRIARTITNYILSKELLLNHQYFSISKAIEKDKKSYYDILERSNNLIHNRHFEFTEWIKWHTEVINSAIEHSLEEIEKVIQKAKFWDHARLYTLNKRQIKVLNKILDKGIDDFEGNLSTKKYAAIAKTSIPTAKRDISRLVEYNLLKHIKGTAGRSTRYIINLEKL